MSKEIFLARISAMRSKQAKNSRAITQEDYDNIIMKLKLLEKKVKGKTIPGFTTNDYNLPNTHEILTVEKNGQIKSVYKRMSLYKCPLYDHSWPFLCHMCVYLSQN